MTTTNGEMEMKKYKHGLIAGAVAGFFAGLFAYYYCTHTFEFHWPFNWPITAQEIKAEPMTISEKADEEETHLKQFSIGETVKVKDDANDCGNGLIGKVVTIQKYVIWTGHVLSNEWLVEVNHGGSMVDCNFFEHELEKIVE
jgi:hypothetical protein